MNLLKLKKKLSISFALPKDQKEFLKRLRKLGKKVKAFAVALVWRF